MKNYRLGYVKPWWPKDDFKNLNYVYTPLTNTDDEERWITEGYTGVTLNGGLYNMKNPMPNYAQPFFTMFDWENVGLSFYKMNTLDMLPMHQDAYNSYVKMFNTTAENVWRCVVFLEDWKSGHYFEIDGKALCNWRAGDYVYWNNDVPHFAGNIGTEPRYTMQITGMQRV
jgi:hypothetical protein